MWSGIREWHRRLSTSSRHFRQSGPSADVTPKGGLVENPSRMAFDAVRKPTSTLNDFLFESDLGVANTLWTVGKEDSSNFLWSGIRFLTSRNPLWISASGRTQYKFYQQITTKSLGFWDFFGGKNCLFGETFGSDIVGALPFSSFTGSARSF